MKNLYHRERLKLVNHLEKMGIRDTSVLKAIGTVPRHIFIGKDYQDKAYSDEALPFQEGQTISQPYIVALMTSILLGENRLSSVLEVGTGSGYQTAILAQIADKIYSVERIRSLVEQAKTRLQSMGINKVEFRHGDGYQGWKEHAPYEGIIVTASPPEVPSALLEQLAEGGRMVIPVGEENDQQLVLYIRHQNKFETMVLEGVRFVPLLTGVR